jgi:shikimate kinase
MAKIFLTGYMGSGKSTAGKKLATKLGFEFIDLDKLIEKECKLSIPEIFSTKGESEFRAVEHNTLKKIVEKENIVVACGGGTPCYYGNMELMNNHGITIYIKMSADALISRLTSATEVRPLVANKSAEELRTFVNRQLEKREDFYHQAQFTVKGKDLNVDELAEFVKGKVEIPLA